MYSPDDLAKLSGQNNREYAFAIQRELLCFFKL
jgi:hypothetical protein